MTRRDVAAGIPLRGPSDDLADALYRRVLGWPVPGPRTDADIVRDLRELVAERARRRRERRERLQP